jgi:glutamate-1-semialdehyde 2,1-aminomutase
LFILDEIVTGFRVSINGAAALYRLEPDLFTIGKIVGGGLPIGAVCGRKEVMSLADPVLMKEKQLRCAIGGGTFSANPLSMTAGLATLTHLKDNKIKVYEKLDRLGNLTRNGLTKIFSEAKIDAQITGAASLFLMHFLDDTSKKITNATDVAMSNNDLLRKYHTALMAYYGIFFLPLKMGTFSDSHDENDVKKLLSATRSIVSSGVLSKNSYHD